MLRSSLPSWGLQQRPRRLRSSAFYSSLLTDGEIWLYTLQRNLQERWDGRWPSHTQGVLSVVPIDIVVWICVVQFILIRRIKDHTISKEFVVLLCLSRGIFGRWRFYHECSWSELKSKTMKKSNEKDKPLHVFFFLRVSQCFSNNFLVSFTFFHILLAGCVWRLLETWMSRLEAGFGEFTSHVWSQSSLVKYFERACWYCIDVCFLSFALFDLKSMWYDGNMCTVSSFALPRGLL